MGRGRIRQGERGDSARCALRPAMRPSKRHTWQWPEACIRCMRDRSGTTAASCVRASTDKRGSSPSAAYRTMHAWRGRQAGRARASLPGNRQLSLSLVQQPLHILLNLLHSRFFDDEARLRDQNDIPTFGHVIHQRADGFLHQPARSVALHRATHRLRGNVANPRCRCVRFGLSGVERTISAPPPRADPAHAFKVFGSGQASQLTCCLPCRACSWPANRLRSSQSS